MANGVLQGIVGGVLQDFGASNNGQRGRDGHDGITRQRETGQYIQCPADAHEIENTRDSEGLYQQSQQVDPTEIVAVKGANIAAHRSFIAGKLASRFLFDDRAQEKLTRRVDDVQDDDQQRDHSQITALKNQLEAVLAGNEIVGVFVHHLVAALGLDAVRRPNERGANYQHRGRCRHKRVRSELVDLEKPRSGLGAEQRPQGRSDADHREQPFSLAFGVNIVREGPKLANHEDVENAYPNIECDANFSAGEAEKLEDQ